MFLLKLFHDSTPDSPVSAHFAGEGRLRVGRDPAADWVVADPDKQVSRTHIELAVADGTLALTPLGANGVFTDAGQPLAHGEPHRIGAGDAVRFGRYRMTVEAAPPPGGRGLEEVTVPPIAPERTQSLLSAFCRGADLDVSAFSGEDPAAVLERAGAIYREMVLGLTSLVAARSEIKGDHGLERTTIASDDNNPFRWAPARRLANDLLLGTDAGFLDGAEAARASFEDARKHMLAALAGFRGATAAILRELRPDTVETRIRSRKSMLQGSAAACWAEYGRQHERVARDCESRTGEIDRAFANAYAARLAELDAAPPEQ